MYLGSARNPCTTLRAIAAERIESKVTVVERREPDGTGSGLVRFWM